AEHWWACPVEEEPSHRASNRPTGRRELGSACLQVRGSASERGRPRRLVTGTFRAQPARRSCGWVAAGPGAVSGCRRTTRQPGDGGAGPAASSCLPCDLCGAAARVIDGADGVWSA
ncbi:uncharacterized protein A4U43_C04F17130, partial [Asparagus officinalis]